MFRQMAEHLKPLRRNRDFVLFQTGQLLSAIGTSTASIAYRPTEHGWADQDPEDDLHDNVRKPQPRHEPDASGATKAVAVTTARLVNEISTRDCLATRRAVTDGRAPTATDGSHLVRMMARP
jgi:hypothetical protein